MDTSYVVDFYDKTYYAYAFMNFSCNRVFYKMITFTTLKVSEWKVLVKNKETTSSKKSRPYIRAPINGLKASFPISPL